MTMDSKESVLSRWSRRKLEADMSESADENNLVEPGIEANEAVVPDAVEAESKPGLTDADMPDIESLDENSDFSAFMSEGVSDELRNLALRKLFKAPLFNIRDGLDEYDEDYTSFEKLGDIITSDMKHQIEMKEQKLREAMAEEAAQDSVDDEDAIEDIELQGEADEEVETLAEAEIEPEIKQQANNEQ